MDTYVYSIEDDSENAQTLYVNLTNKCTNRCIFCIRNTVDSIKGKPLFLKNKGISANEVIEQFKNYNTPKEVVFCGFGEPFEELEVLKEVSKILKDKGIKIRVNTNGHGNIINQRNIVPELKGLVDEISVSLNADSSEAYDKISKPNFSNAYEEVKNFIKECVDNGFETTASIVSKHPDFNIDINECEKIAHSLGAKFRNRTWLNNGY